MKTLLLVEDEREILENNRCFFETKGYRVLTAENIAGAREHLTNERPDAIVLDIMLPDGNGLDILKELREAGSKTPVIMLTAWGKPSDVARGLQLGANDYLSKPFTYEVLLARVETMFRNVEQMPEAVKKGRLTLKVRPMEVLVAGQKIKLPPVEFFMLQLFIENEGKVLKAETLYEQVWGADMGDDAQAVQKAVSRLRKKIAGSGYAIAAVYGDSYRFEREQ
jgi:DNA-binding response OmpR family regulator